MSGWESRLCASIRSAVVNDSFWGSYFDQALRGKDYSAAVHLGVFVEPYLRFVLEGKKTVESRFSSNLCAPHKKIEQGDVVLLKKSGGAVVGLCLVSSAWFYELDPDSWRDIRQGFGEALCANGPEFWRTRKNASYATLMRLSHVTRLDPVRCEKRDRRGWVVVRRRSSKPALFRRRQ